MLAELDPLPMTGTSAGVMPLGDSELDEVHREFAQLIGALADCSAAQMPGTMSALGAHCRSHFGAEDAWMEESDFPARACHQQEHAAVLASIEGVTRRVAAGDIAAGRTLAAALAEWFPAHTIHLDSALVHWRSKRRWGGKPVVLQRRPRASTHLEHAT